MSLYKLIFFFGILIFQKYVNFIFTSNESENIKQKEKDKIKLNYFTKSL